MARRQPKPYLRDSIWWIKFYKNGQPIRESSHSTDEAKARSLLKVRLGQVESGEYRGPTQSRVLVAALLDLVVEDYKISKKRSLDDLEYRIDKNLRKTLGTVRASMFSSTHVDNHIRSRRSTGASDATINRELAIVRRAFSLGMRTDPPLVNRKPWIRRLDEDNAREGFIEEDQYRTLLNELPEHLRALFVVGYHIGARLGTLRKLEWDQVDLKGGQIRLRKKQVKQKRAHTAPIYGHIRAWLEMQSSDRDQNWPNCSYVFHWHDRPIGAHLKGWREACKRAGLPGLKFHDLRRSAVRNMERAGMPRNVAMGITGHRTEAVYRRYDIVSEKDMQLAASRMDEFFEAQRKDQKEKDLEVKRGKSGTNWAQ
jgi:integrase